jgi:DNA-binding transcriptional ArsR family regulator
MIDNSGSQTDREQPVGQQILQALANPRNRAILQKTAATPYSAKQLSDACDIPTSTVYRRINDLVEAGLLEEQLKFNPDGKNSHEYRLRISAVQIAFPKSDDSSAKITVGGIDALAIEPSEDMPRGLSTDGGTISNEESPTTDETCQRLSAIFQVITGTDTIVEEQEQEPSVRFASETDTGSGTGTLQEFVAAQAKADGLSDAIDGLDQM